MTDQADWPPDPTTSYREIAGDWWERWCEICDGWVIWHLYSLACILALTAWYSGALEHAWYDPPLAALMLGVSLYGLQKNWGP